MIVDFDGQQILLYFKVRWFLGNINENLSFEFGDETTAYGGCGATLNGEFWYFGGYDFYKNVSLSLTDFRIYNPFFTFFQTVGKIVDCRLDWQSLMDFDLSYPACNTFLEPTPKVLLCFHEYDDKLCYS